MKKLRKSFLCNESSETTFQSAIHAKKNLYVAIENFFSNILLRGKEVEGVITLHKKEYYSCLMTNLYPMAQ